MDIPLRDATLCTDILQISTGDLNSNVAKLEKQLSLHFELADHWNTLLLLDKTDMFLCKRDTDHTHNSLVSVFLYKLEYYQGIILLTTNRIRDFNNIIQSRIHLTLRYSPLDINTRKEIWNIFLQNTITTSGKVDYSNENLNNFIKHNLNNRQIYTYFFEIINSYTNKFLFQIRNIIRIVYILIFQEGAIISYSHLEIVINSGKEFETNV